jgi:hypothetical protein
MTGADTTPVEHCAVVANSSGISSSPPHALATAAAYLFYFLHIDHGLDWKPAFFVAVFVAGPLMGLGANICSKGYFQAPTLEHFLQQAERASVEIMPTHHTVPWFQRLEHRRGSCQARSESSAILSFFKRGQALFECFSSWILRSRVLESLVLPWGRLSVGRAEMDGRDGGTSGGVGFLAHMNRTRGKFHMEFS